MDGMANSPLLTMGILLFLNVETDDMIAPKGILERKLR
jgi:hypothetical protein